MQYVLKSNFVDLDVGARRWFRCAMPGLEHITATALKSLVTSLDSAALNLFWALTHHHCDVNAGVLVSSSCSASCQLWLFECIDEKTSHATTPTISSDSALLNSSVLESVPMIRDLCTCVAHGILVSAVTNSPLSSTKSEDAVLQTWQRALRRSLMGTMVDSLGCTFDAQYDALVMPQSSESLYVTPVLLEHVPMRRDFRLGLSIDMLNCSHRSTAVLSVQQLPSVAVAGDETVSAAAHLSLDAYVDAELVRLRGAASELATLPDTRAYADCADDDAALATSATMPSQRSRHGTPAQSPATRADVVRVHDRFAPTVARRRRLCTLASDAGVADDAFDVTEYGDALLNVRDKEQPVRARARARVGVCAHTRCRVISHHR
jgi:hypothetical protein